MALVGRMAFTRRMTAPWGWVSLLGAVGIALPVAGAAQDALDAAPPRAWLGIMSQAVQYPGERGFAVLVTDVFAPSPAHRGGLQPGDLVVSVNGSPLSDYHGWLDIVLDLEIGRPLEVGLLRAGRADEVTIVAEPRPQLQGPFDPMRFESIQQRIWHAADSILRLMAAGNAPDTLIPAFRSPGDRVRVAEARVQIRWRGPASERRDTLRAAREVEREMEMDEPPRPTADGLAPPTAGGGGSLRAAAATSDMGSPRALTPLILRGPVVLGGVEVREVTAELGQYFGVAAGVLVTRVLDMSPAQRAGFREGDVIRAVGNRAIGSVEDLRVALAESTLPVGISVTRRGDAVEVTYPPPS